MKKWLAALLLMISTSSIGFSQKGFSSWDEALQNKEVVVHLKLRKQWHEMPDSIFLFPNLRSLDLTKNKLTEIPPQLRQLQQLESLNLKKNEIQKLPRWLGQLPNLNTLILAHNPIDSIKLYHNTFSSLEKLDLWETDIRYISPSICEIPQLAKIDLRHTYLGKKDLKWLYDCLGSNKVESTQGCNCD